MERREDAAVYPEVRMPHVSALNSALHLQCDAAEMLGVHHLFTCPKARSAASESIQPSLHHSIEEDGIAILTAFVFMNFHTPYSRTLHRNAP